MSYCCSSDWSHSDSIPASSSYIAGRCINDLQDISKLSHIVIHLYSFLQHSKFFSVHSEVQSQFFPYPKIISSHFHPIAISYTVKNVHIYGVLIGFQKRNLKLIAYSLLLEDWSDNTLRQSIYNIGIPNSWSVPLILKNILVKLVNLVRIQG